MRAEEGVLPGGLPFVRFGSGPPLLFIQGLTGTHANPRGITRILTVRPLQPVARHFTVYVVNRRPGLPVGTTMADIADDYARAIRGELGRPVAVVGSSTGGSVAQEVAVDHPGLVARLVLADTACRLSPDGRRVQADLAELTAAGRPREAWAALGRAMAASDAGARLMAAALWVMAPAMDPDDPADMVATIRAEDAFDLSGLLHRIAAPTLLVAGERDRFYTPELFRETAAGIPGCRLILYPGRGHGVLTHRDAVDEVIGFLTAGD